MSPLLKQLTENSKLSMLRNATWTLSNFCRGKPKPDFNFVRPALPTLAQLIYSTDDDVLTDSCWALSYLSDGPNDKIQAVIEAGVCRRLVELLMHQSPSVQTPALRTVGNIVTGDNIQTQHILNFSVLPSLFALLSSPKKGIPKEACWTISNITAGNRDQIQAVIDANIIPPLIKLLQTAEFDIKKEAAWAISNFTSGGTPEQIKLLVNEGCIGPLSDLLGADDPKIVNVALEGLENILKVGKKDELLGNGKASGDENHMAKCIRDVHGLSPLASLRAHTTESIKTKAMKILETYFSNCDIDPIIEQQHRSAAASNIERIVRGKLVRTRMARIRVYGQRGSTAASNIERIVRGKLVRARIAAWHGKARILQRTFTLFRNRCKRSAAAARIQVFARDFWQRRSAATKIQAHLRMLLISRPERLKKHRHREAKNAATVATAEKMLDEFKCPISLNLPAPEDRLFCVVDGETYHEAYITKWVKDHKRSPMTREPVALTDLVTVRESKLLTRPRTAEVIPETLKALKAVGFEAAKAKRQGFDAAQCKAGGYDALELKNGGFELEALVQCFDVPQLRAANFGLQALQLRGSLSLEQLKRGGVTATDLRSDCNCSVQELKTAGGFSAKDCVDANFSLTSLKNGGFTAGELKSTQKFSLEQFVGAGFSADDLKLACFTSLECVEAGLGITTTAAAFKCDIDLLAVELVDKTKQLRAKLAGK